jgi:hypothetical protein
MLSVSGAGKGVFVQMAALATSALVVVIVDFSVDSAGILVEIRDAL